MAVNLKSLLQKTTLLQPADLDLTGDKSCPVCLDPYFHTPSNEAPRRLPCGHVLGTECLLVWAAGQANTKEGVTCPWCRKVVVKKVLGMTGDSDINVEGRHVRWPVMTFIREVIHEMGFGHQRVEHWGEITAFCVLGYAALAAYFFYFDEQEGWLLGLSFVLFALAVRNVEGAVVAGGWIDAVVLRGFFGAVLVLVGLGVGAGGHWVLGRALMAVGKMPLRKVMGRAFGGHGWKVSLGVDVVLGVLAGAATWDRGMIVGETVVHGFRYLVLPGLVDGMR